jgi:uncharacterized protein (TIGR03437 family)
MRSASLTILSLTCFFLSSGLAPGQTASQTVTFSYSGSPLSIPVNNVGVPTVAEIYVPRALKITSVTAQVQVDYPNVSDLTLYLFSANGTRSVLLNNDCGGLTNIDTTFDDKSPSRYSDFCPKEAGRGPFRADEPLANSTGELSVGYWDLAVRNTKSSTNTGLLRGFSVTITGTPITTPTFTSDAVVNSASLDGGVVAPGELVSIYGVALGPQQGVLPGTGALPTSLGGTTVTFDGVPAPLLYSSFYQVNVQAPFTLTPGTRTRIQVQASGGPSSAVLVDVLSSVAGLYTVSSNGRGQVLAVNQDGTQNSTTNPAAAGSFISLYATGLGAVTPSVTAGAVAPNAPLSTVNGGITVIIGGLVAPVSYVGLAPGYTGLYQINAQIPAGAAPGTRLVFVVSPNGYSSQARSFIAVQ